MEAPAISGKARSIELRLNGKVLPFVGLHAMLLSLVFQLADGEQPLQLFFTTATSFAWAVAGVALLLFALYALPLRHLPVARVSGGLAAPVLLSMIAVSMLTPEGVLQLAAPMLLYFALLLAAVLHRVESQEVQIVYLYLPAIYLGALQLPLGAQLAAAFLLYLPAIYAQFIRNKVASKVPLGVSMLIYLAVIVARNEESHALVTLLITLALVLFIAYSVFTNKDKGSSQKHFLVDVIVVGLWGTLLAVDGVDEPEAYFVQWGLGVLLYQGAKLVWYHRGKAAGVGRLAARDAALGWLLLGAMAVFFDWLANGPFAGLEGDRGYYLAGLILLVPFVPVFRRAQAPLLASITRIGMVIVLLSGVAVTEDYFSNAYTALQYEQFDAIAGRVDPDSLGSDPSAELPAPAAGTFGWLVPPKPEPERDIKPLEDEFALTWHALVRGELILLALLLVGGYVATLRVVAGYKVPWWRGMIRPRHMVLARQFGRMVLKNAKSIPVFGVLIGWLGKVLDWLSFVSGRSAGEFSRNLMILAVHVCGVAMTVLVLRYLTQCCGVAEGEGSLLRDWRYLLPLDLYGVIAWCLWGVLLYLFGGFASHAPARFYAVAFVMAPVLGIAQWGDMSDPLFVEALLLVGLTFFLFGGLRKAQ